MTVEETALLASIITHPDEDTPRLVYADWLQEQEPVFTPCEHCDGEGWFPTAWTAGSHISVSSSTNVRSLTTDVIARRQCPRCSGAGRKRTDTFRERAEFIRVQCAIAAPSRHPCRACGKPIRSDRIADGCPCNSPRGVNHGIVPAYVCTCPECDPVQTGGTRVRPDEVIRLYAREHDLLFASPRQGETNGVNWLPQSIIELIQSENRMLFPDGERFVWRRGFVDEISCSGANWVKLAEAILAENPVTRVRLTTHVLSSDRTDNVPMPSMWYAKQWPRITFDLPH